MTKTLIMKKIGLIFTMLLFVLITNGQNKDYHLYFKSGIISLDENMREMTSLDQIFQDKNLSWNGYEYCILQFYNLPDQQEKNNLKAQGILLGDYMPENAFLAGLPLNINVDLLKETGVRAILPFSSKFKLDPIVAEITNVPDEAWTKNNDINISVIYFDNLSVGDFTSDLKTKFDVLPKNVNEQYKTFEVAIPYDRLEEFAALPYIKYIQEAVTISTLDDESMDAFHGARLLQLPSYNNLTGEGVTVAMSDMGNPIENIDFKGRLNDDSYDDNYYQGDEEHGDHTAGIVGSAGNFNELYKGVAPRCDLIVYDGEGATAAADDNPDIVITSISMNFGGKTCPYLGRYNNRSRTEDLRITQHPYLLECFSAGNYSSTGCYDEHNALFGINEGEASAKNTLTVGATYDNTILSKDQYINDASKGPVVDRRIKPEIIALGKIVSNVNFNEYRRKSGSSMSTPVVAGSAALLYELYRDRYNGDNPDAALIKAVLCNTAEDADNEIDGTENPGPDFSSGFGYLNTYRAVQAIDSSWFTSATLDNGKNQSVTINVPEGIAKLKVMICWSDPAAAAFAQHTLVNNIDLELYDPDNTLYRPWVLDTVLGHWEDNAVRGIDNINNIEQVTIDDPESGNYTIKVNGTHVPTGPQKVWITYFMVSDFGFKFLNPVEGTSYFPGQKQIRIGFDVNKDIESNSNNFSVSYDDGATWQSLGSNNNTLNAQFYWKYDIPTGIQTGKAKFRMEFEGFTFYSDYFSVMDIPTNVRALYAQNGTTKLKWDPVPGAVKYEVFKLGDKFMESIGTTTDNSFLANQTDHMQDNYFAVRAYGPNDAISRRSKPVFVPAGEFSINDQSITEFPYKESFEGNYNTTRFGSFYHAEAVGGEDYRFRKGSFNAGMKDSGPRSASDGTFYAYVLSYEGRNKFHCLDTPSLVFANMDNPHITFDYHMRGEGMGSLYVLITDDDGATWDTLFQKSGEQGDKWFKERVSLQQYSNKTVKIRFIGLSGESIYSEMAIDNVVVDNQKETEADFYVLQRSVEVGDTVQFSNYSSENTNNWVWVFEGADTDTSYAENPKVIYNNPGIHKVELTAISPDGADTKVKIGYIVVKETDAYCYPHSFGNAAYYWPDKLIFDEQTYRFDRHFYFFLSNNELHLNRGENPFTIIKEEISSDESYSLERRIWIDFDSDGNFETDESIYLGSASTDDTLPGDIMIPFDKDYQGYRMRMAVRDASISNSLDCSLSYHMALYDFVIIVDTVPQADFTANKTEIEIGESITFTDASTDNVAKWLWDFDNNGTHTYSTAKNPVITFNDPGTYTVNLIVSNYYGSDTITKTDYITVVSTGCTVSSFPWTEDFENGGNIPDCWADEHVTDTQNWAFITGSTKNHPDNAHSGTYNACLYNASSVANVTRLVTPEIKLDNLQNPTLTFWHTQQFWSPDQDYLKLYYKEHPDSSWVLIKEWTNDISTWTEETITLPEKSNHYYLAFEGWAKYGYGVCIDDVTVKEGPTDPPDCTNPVSPSDNATNVDITANLEWESATGATGYKLYLGTNDPPDNMLNGVDVGYNTQYDPVDNFNKNATYYWKIIPYNSFGDASGCSVWSFTTSSNSCSYCSTSYGNTADDYITKVVFNQISKTSGTSNYSDFTSVSTDADKGQSYTLSVDVKVNGSWIQKVKAWFDWNGDCDFDDEGEAFSIGQTPGQSGTFTISSDITIPSAANTGETRMRVAEHYYSDPTACGNSTYGEAEDYTVNITGGSREMTGLPKPTARDFGVSIYPNPVNNDIVYVESDRKMDKIYVYNVDGTVVMTIMKEQQTKVELNVSKLPVGLYFVKVITDKQIIIQKLIRN